MPTSPRELVEAMEKHPDFKFGVLKLLLEEAKIANVWEWGTPDEVDPDDPEDEPMPKFRRMTAWDAPLAVVWCKTPPKEYHRRFGGNGSEWVWVVYDPFHPKQPTALAQGTGTSALRARRGVDAWLKAHGWTVPGTYMTTE